MSYPEFDFSHAQQQEQDPTNLYIANLPSYMTENDLETMLSGYGTVISTRILRDPTGQPRGVGFARLVNYIMFNLISFSHPQLLILKFRF